jgi:pseudaminic acid cytidylyltransferase
MRVAVIPARGGSKRIPRKNIREFFNKPMLAYSINAAQDAALFDEIVVSTDDPEIADIAQRYGAAVPFMRPAELADDYAITADVIAHAIEFYQAQKKQLEAVCCIYATAPFLTGTVLKQSWQQFAQQDLAFLFSATAFDFPIQRAVYFNQQQRVAMFQPEFALTRSQDLPKAYHDAGQFYWGKPRAWLEKWPIFAEHSSMYVLPGDQVQDIDTPEDWRRAEVLFRLQKEG